MMRKIQRFGAQLLLLILSLIGAGIAIYLTAVHYENVPLLCSTSGVIDCSRVLSSPYSVIPGTTIPITLLGLAWCVVSAILAIAGLRLLERPEERRIRIVQLIWALAGMLTVLYLVYVEIVLLHTICAWCTALHAIILAMLLTSIVQLQRRDGEAEPDSDEAIPDEVGTSPGLGRGGPGSTANVEIIPKQG